MARGVVPDHDTAASLTTSDRERATCCMLSPTVSFFTRMHESRMRRIQEWASEREVRRGIKAVLVLISLAYAMPVHVHSRRMPWVNDFVFLSQCGVLCSGCFNHLGLSLMFNNFIIKGSQI